MASLIVFVPKWRSIHYLWLIEADYTPSFTTNRAWRPRIILKVFNSKVSAESSDEIPYSTSFASIGRRVGSAIKSFALSFRKLLSMFKTNNWSFCSFSSVADVLIRLVNRSMNLYLSKIIILASLSWVYINLESNLSPAYLN